MGEITSILYILVIVGRGTEIDVFKYLQFANWLWHWLGCCQFIAFFHKFDKRLRIQCILWINILLTLFKSESNSKWKWQQPRQLPDSDKLWSKFTHLSLFVTSLVLIQYRLQCKCHLFYWQHTYMYVLSNSTPQSTNIVGNDYFIVYVTCLTGLLYSLLRSPEHMQCKTQFKSKSVVNKSLIIMIAYFYSSNVLWLNSCVCQNTARTIKIYLDTICY